MQRILVYEKQKIIILQYFSSLKELTRKYLVLGRAGKALCGGQIWLNCENDKHGTPEKVDLGGCG